MTRRALLAYLCSPLAAGALIWGPGFPRPSKVGGWKDASPTPVLDGYGGLRQRVAPAGGFFRVQKTGHRWLFVTPEGNPFWMLGVFDIASPTADYDAHIRAKYGSRRDWGIQAARRLKSWGFNTAAEYSSAWVTPISGYGPRNTTAPIPFVEMFRPAYYCLRNHNGYAPGAVKDLIAGLSQDYRGYRGGSLPDVFDPNFARYAVGSARAEMKSAVAASPWLVGTAIGDSDDLWGFGPGPDAPTTPPGKYSSHIGWIALCTNFEQHANSRLNAAYSDPKVYAKYALADGLQRRYGNIAALNSAWGAQYTSFGSAGGYGRGSGLLDEDGRHGWIGVDDVHLRGTNPAVRTDLDSFLGEFAERFFSVATEAIRQARPHQLIFGPATLNGWDGLTRAPILAAAGRHVDVVQANCSTQRIYDLTLHATGDRPLVTWAGFTANRDSDLYAFASAGSTGYPTQEKRADAYARRLEADFGWSGDTAAGALAASRNIAGMKLWAWSDSWREKENWGLVSLLDNSYDGHEAVRARGRDRWGFATGGEARNYGNFLSGVRTANSVLMRQLSRELAGPAHAASAHGL